MTAEGASAISNLEDILDISEEDLKALSTEARQEYEDKKAKLDLQKTVLKALADSERDAAKKRDEAAKEYLQITMGLQKFVKETGPEKTKADLRKMIADGTFKGMLKDPTFDQMVTWKRQQQKAKGTETMRQHASKAIARLPKFSGDEHKLTWEAFMTHISVITSNIDYTEAEIKQILVGALEGAAFQFLNANPELLEKPYGELIEALRKEFQRSHPQALALLQGAKQMPKESVREFASRIKIYSKAISPSAPPPIRSYEQPDLNTAQLVLNPLAEIEEYDYRARMEMVGTLQLNSFLAGLRADLQARMPAKKYLTFDEAVDAAQEAEYFVNIVGWGGQINALVVEENEQVNALNYKKQGQGKNRSGTSRYSTSEELTCWHCEKPGHMKHECPELNSHDKNRSSRYTQRKGKQQYRNRSTSRGRYNSRQNSRDNSRGRSPMTRLASEFKNLDMSQVNTLLKTLKKVATSQDRKRSRSRSRDGKTKRVQINAMSKSKNE